MFSLVYYRSLVYSYTWSRLCHHQIQLFSIHSSSISSSCPAPLVLCWKSRIWSINEFECLPVIWLIGGGINSPTSGWSGMHVKNVSSLALNWSTVQLVRFLIDLGKELKSLVPWTWKDCSLIDITRCDAFLAILGNSQLLPNLESWLDFTLIPHSGTMLSTAFHVYMILYRSILRCSEFIFRSESRI